MCVYVREYTKIRNLSVCFLSHTGGPDMCVRSPLTGCQSGSHCWDALNLSHLNLSTDGHIVSASSNAHLCCGLKGDCAVYQRAAIFKSRTLSRISVSCQVTTASPSSFPSLSLSLGVRPFPRVVNHRLIICSVKSQYRFTEMQG